MTIDKTSRPDRFETVPKIYEGAVWETATISGSHHISTHTIHSQIYPPSGLTDSHALSTQKLTFATNIIRTPYKCGNLSLTV
jgi:hypothetical protein